MQNEPHAFEAWGERAAEADDEEEIEEEIEEIEEEIKEAGEEEAGEEEREALVGTREREAPSDDLADVPARSDGVRVHEVGADYQGGAEMAATKEATEAWGEVVEGPLNMPLDAFRPGARDASAAGNAAAGTATLLRKDVADDLVRQRNRSVLFVIVGGVAAIILLAAWALLHSGGSGTRGYAYAKGLSQDETIHDVEATAGGLSARSRHRRATPRPATAERASAGVEARARVPSEHVEDAARRFDEAPKQLRFGRPSESLARGGTSTDALDVEWAGAFGPARHVKASDLD